MMVLFDIIVFDDVVFDVEMIVIYVDVVFGYCDGWVLVCVFVEKGVGDGLLYVFFIEVDVMFVEKFLFQVIWVSSVGMVLFVVFGMVFVSGDVKVESIVQMQVVLVDFDYGDIGVKCDYFVQYFGCLMFEVVFGGVIVEGQCKLYFYWCLFEFVEGEDIVMVCCVWYMIVVKVGGDLFFWFVYQLICVVGLIYVKQG